MPASRSPSRATERGRSGAFWAAALIGLFILLAAVAYALPASLIAHFLPNQVHAEDFSGSLWHGAAGKINVNARDAGAIEWRLHPASLLRLMMVADIHWVKVGFVVDGTVRISREQIEARDVQGGGPIDDLRDIGIAAGWRGNAKLQVAGITSDFTKVVSAEGSLEVADISSAQIAEGENLGGYVLQLAPGAVSADGRISASLNDTGGPVEVRARIQVSPASRTAVLSGTLKERDEASPALRNELNSLAQVRPRDSQGRFPVELEFTF
jgi:hypothetical protein